MLKSKPFTLVAFGFFLFGLSSELLPAQNNQMTVECTDEIGGVLRDVTVWVWAVPSGKPLEKKTNKQGFAEFKKLNDGTYRVWARAEGFEPTFFEFLHLPGNASETVSLKLKAGDFQKALYFEDPSVRDQATQLLNEGTQAMQGKKTEEAIEKYKASLVINPSSIDAHHNLGLAYLDRRDYDLAVGSLNEEIKLLDVFKLQGVDPSAVDQRIGEVHKLIGFIPILVLQGEAEDAFSAKDFPLAVQKLQQIADLQPDNPNLRFNLATAQFQAQQFEDAMVSIDQALEKDPDNKAMQDLKRAISQGRRGLLVQQSREKLTELSKFYKEGNFQEFVNRGNALSGEIVEELQPALWHDMVRAYTELNDVDGTANAYRKVIEVAPDKPEYLKQFGQYLIDQGRVEDGVGVYSDYLEKQSEPVAPGLFTLGEEAARKGKEELALELYRYAMKADAGFAEPYYALGMQHYFAQEFDKARELLGKYLELGKDEGRLDNVKTVLTVIEKLSKK